jgi:hypothetical protein
VFFSLLFNVFVLPEARGNGLFFGYKKGREPLALTLLSGGTTKHLVRTIEKAKKPHPEGAACFTIPFVLRLIFGRFPEKEMR